VLLPATLVLGACDPDVAHPDDMESPDDDDDLEDPSSEDPSSEDPSSDDPPATPPEAAFVCDPDVWGGYACTTEDGQAGTNFCIVVDAEELYTPCSTTPPECQPGDGFDYGCMGEICYWDGEAFHWYSWSEDDCETPLVVSFDGAPIEFTPAVAASFDLSTDGSCMSTDWPSAPWLALDRDGDGSIRDGSELFGSATKLSSGGHAEHGFAALAELDTDRDGKITAADARFGELVLWSDLDDDRIGAYSELQPLRETTLVSIDLGFDRRASCDRQGNCGYERASFEYRTSEGRLAVGEVVDVHLACR
jgi:hypothetical protein